MEQTEAKQAVQELTMTQPDAPFGAAPPLQRGNLRRGFFRAFS